MSDVFKCGNDPEFLRQAALFTNGDTNLSAAIREAADEIESLRARLAAAEADSEKSADRNYIAGVQQGFRLGLEDDYRAKEAIIAGRRKELADAARGGDGDE